MQWPQGQRFTLQCSTFGQDDLLWQTAEHAWGWSACDAQHAKHAELPFLQAGATAVVPETLEPSLQLASAVLSELKMPQEEVAQVIQTFRKTHISDLQVGPG